MPVLDWQKCPILQLSILKDGQSAAEIQLSLDQETVVNKSLSRQILAAKVVTKHVQDLKLRAAVLNMRKTAHISLFS